METEDIIIHLHWDGPHKLDEIPTLDKPTDFGVYQMYGGHPVYGDMALLYIGIAERRKFAQRIPEHWKWAENRDAGRIEVYVGRIRGLARPDDETWNRHIRLAERLLIFAHSPPLNTQKELAGLEPDLHRVHVLNWDRHRDLLPEVSGARWSNRFAEPPLRMAYSEIEDQNT